MLFWALFFGIAIANLREHGQLLKFRPSGFSAALLYFGIISELAALASSIHKHMYIYTYIYIYNLLVELKHKLEHGPEQALWTHSSTYNLQRAHDFQGVVCTCKSKETPAE